MQKVVYNGSVIDVLEDPIWVLQGPGVRLRCEKENAQGVVSSDLSTTYHIAGTQPLDGADSMISVSTIFVGPEEGKALLEQLKAGAEITEPEEQEPEEVMSAAKMCKMIAELTESVQELEAQNAMLTDCLLEMSEVVYAGE